MKFVYVCGIFVAGNSIQQVMPLMCCSDADSVCVVGTRAETVAAFAAGAMFLAGFIFLYQHRHTYFTSNYALTPDAVENAFR